MREEAARLEAQRRAEEEAARSVLDLTRNIQRRRIGNWLTCNFQW